MLEWVKAKNYEFYVKDLVQYLKEYHDYKGCDGTIRRGLVRAGFKRKLVSRELLQVSYETVVRLRSDTRFGIPLNPLH